MEKGTNEKPEQDQYEDRSIDADTRGESLKHHCEDLVTDLNAFKIGCSSFCNNVCDAVAKTGDGQLPIYKEQEARCSPKKVGEEAPGGKIEELLSQNMQLKRQIELLQSNLEVVNSSNKNLERTNAVLISELEQLRNDALDREYENGFFIEEEVFRRIERENCRLRKKCDDVYGDITRVWFKMIEDKIKANEFK